MCQANQDDLDRQAYLRVFASVNTYDQFDETELRGIRDIVIDRLCPTRAARLEYHLEQVAALEEQGN